MADLGASAYDGSEATREAARRVVKGDISPSTTTSSAWFELDYDGYDHEGARGERLSRDGRGDGSSHDASFRRRSQVKRPPQTTIGRHRWAAVPR